MALAVIDIDKIETGRRLRQVGDAKVEMLANSIADVGVLNPITVYRRAVIRSGVSVEGYGLIAGLHRMQACQKLGLTDVPAHIVDLSELQRQIAECDENLCSASLSKSERAMFTRRRKEAYEALHPETRHGGDRKSDQVAKSATCSEEDNRFTFDTAAKTGHSERTVQLDAERGEKVADDVLVKITGTHLDTGVYLDRLKKLSPDEQRAKVKSDLAFSETKKSVGKPAAPLDDTETRDKWLRSGMSWWNRGSQEWREEFLSRVDQRVMDARYAAA